MTCIYVIHIEIIKVHAGQTLPCRWVIGNKEFTISGHMLNIVLIRKLVPYNLALLLYHKSFIDCCIKTDQYVNKSTDDHLINYVDHLLQLSIHTCSYISS